MTFTAFMERELGPHRWAISRRTKSFVEKYGEDAIALSQTRYRALHAAWIRSEPCQCTCGGIGCAANKENAA